MIFFSTLSPSAVSRSHFGHFSRLRFPHLIYGPTPSPHHGRDLKVCPASNRFPPLSREYKSDAFSSYPYLYPTAVQLSMETLAESASKFFILKHLGFRCMETMFYMRSDNLPEQWQNPGHLEATVLLFTGNPV